MISAKLEEGNVRAGKRLAASNDTVASLDNDTFEKLQSKLSLRVPNHAQQVVEDCLITFQPIVAKAINSFPSGSSRRPSLLVHKFYKVFIAKSNGPICNELEANKRTKYSLRGQCHCRFETFFFGAKLISLREEDRGTRPIALGSTNDKLITLVRISTAEQIVERQLQHMFFQTSLRTSIILKTLV